MHNSMLHIPPTNLLLLAAKQEPYKKACLLTKNIKEFSGKSSSRQKKTERVTGVGRRTKEEIAKWNQMTALRFQTGVRHQGRSWKSLERQTERSVPKLTWQSCTFYHHTNNKEIQTCQQLLITSHHWQRGELPPGVSQLIYCNHKQSH